MRRARMARGYGVAAGALALLAGCGQKQKVVSTPAPPPPVQAAPPAQPAPPPPPAAPKPVPGRSPQQRYQIALQSLQQGDPASARVELQAALQDRPGDRRATSLLRTIDADPRQLYGADSFSYTVAAGDTLFSLARKFLHDPMNFYGLARFNNLTLPVELQPGQTILIPGRPRAPERAYAAPRRPTATTGQGPAAAAGPASSAEPTAAARGRAQQLRQQGLEQMSAGSIDRAVTLLSQAASLDPGNAAITGDLARARRIQATVHSK